MAKGSAFEREVCKMLSLWWSRGQSSDIFWRTAMSGGRATVRRKKGLVTRHHNGDIDAIDPTGKPLTDLLLIEIKRGYNRTTFADLLDAPVRAAEQQWAGWIAKARTTQRAAGIAHWFLIARRDKRVALCAFPWDLTERLRDLGCWGKQDGLAVANLSVNIGGEREKFTVMRLGDFLAKVSPTAVKYLVRNC